MNLLSGLRAGWYGIVAPHPAPPARGTDPDRAYVSPRLWAVRWDWPDGTHEFIGLQRDEAAAVVVWSGQVLRWRRFPCRPRMSMVAISGHDFWLHARHRRGCMAPDCPAVAGVVAP